jgi:putative ABC transport system ATP-binding protein
MEVVMKECAIETADLYKSFSIGKEITLILQNINLSVYKRDFLTIMGPSGSGKSTLLYLLGGLDKPTKGIVKVLGNEISGLTDSAESSLRRRELGFIFQFYNLIPNLDVEDNVLLPIILENKNRKDYMKQLDQILNLVGLSGHRKHRPGQLSGGQQQRVAIARALINNPDIILADEPTGNLDSKTGNEILSLLHEINEVKGKTIIMVTHSKEASDYGTRSIYLKDGAIHSDSMRNMEEGVAEDLPNRYNERQVIKISL